LKPTKPTRPGRENAARRARWLAIFGAVLPGSVQLMQRSKALGRLGIILNLITLVGIAIALTGAFNPALLISIASQPRLLWLIAGVAVGWSLSYLLLSADTLRRLGLKQLGFARAAAPALVLILGASLVLTASWQAVSISTAQARLVEIVFQNRQLTEPALGRYNILLLGADAGKNRIGLRPDSISVLSIDAETGRTLTIGLPRNLQRVQFSLGSPMRTIYPQGFDCGKDCLLNAIYTEVEENYPQLYPLASARGSSPGIEATREAVEFVTGLEIQSFVLIDMAGFSDIVQALGGVSVSVETAIPIGGKYNDAGELENPRDWIQPGRQLLNGEQALWFARSRYLSSDYERMGRQRELQRALLQQLDPVSVAANFADLANATTGMLLTDIPRDMLPKYGELALLARAQGLRNLELVPPLVDVIQPDFDQIRGLVTQSLASDSPD
jgi:polyisoprenyl-teichoic acid--peptidoglycan teichoic acid transferase